MGVEIAMKVGYYPNELDVDDWESIASASCIFYGEFRWNDDDGINAVTLTLPDADGIVRAHPY